MVVESETKSYSGSTRSSVMHGENIQLRSNSHTNGYVTPPTKRDRSNTHASNPNFSGSPKQSIPANGTNSPIEQNSQSVNVPEMAPVPNFNFKPTCVIRETHNQSVFGAAFNSINRSRPTDPLLLATVAGHYVTIYQCHLKNSSEDQNSSSSDMPCVSLLQSFVDPAGDKEEFYCCAWSRDTSGNVASIWWTDCAETRRPHSSPHPHQGPTHCSSASLLPPHQQIVAAAGKRGVIRILCPSMSSCPASLVGHGSAINELRFHPRDPALLFSFSKDYTIRLWNVASHVLVCIFGGAEGHRAEVLHGDLSLTGDLLLSAGMDHCIKIWRLNTPELANAVIDSFTYRARSNPKPFPVLIQHFPEFSSRDVHGNYVDCARWFGALVISKSCENSVTLWKPGSLDDSSQLAYPVSIGSPVNNGTEVGGVRLPSRIQPIGTSTNPDFPIPPAPGVPTEHKTSIIHQLKAPDCNLWYIRFDVDLKNQVLALGTGTGPSRVYLWDLKYPEAGLNLPAQVLHVPTGSGNVQGGVPLSHSAIRQTRFANDGNILVCVGDNGLIVRFDKI